MSSILLTVYDILLKRPKKSNRDDTILETFTDINNYPTGLNPSTFVVVKRKKKKKRKKSYDYPQILYPQQYYPTRTSNTDFIANPNYQMLASYNQPTNVPPPPLPVQQPTIGPYRGTGLLTTPSAASIPPQTRYYQPPVTSYRYQPTTTTTANWPRTETNPMTYHNTEAINTYVQRGIYRPTRLNPIEQREEPRVLHYYTGFDHFSTVDPSDIILTRHHQQYPGRNSPVRHHTNPSYYPQSDFLKSAM